MQFWTEASSEVCNDIYVLGEYCLQHQKRKRTSRGTTKYGYLKSSHIQGLISHYIVITLICGFFCGGVGGRGGVRVISMFCRKTSFFIFYKYSVS